MMGRTNATADHAAPAKLPICADREMETTVHPNSAMTTMPASSMTVERSGGLTIARQLLPTTVRDGRVT